MYKGYDHELVHEHGVDSVLIRKFNSRSLEAVFGAAECTRDVGGRAQFQMSIFVCMSCSCMLR